MTLTENTSVMELPPGDSSQEATPTLTRNSILTRILDSPCIDPEVSAATRARARGRRKSKKHQKVDMREVDMVPNFSYPIAGTRWCERRNIEPLFLDDGNREEQERAEAIPVDLGIKLHGDNDSDATITHYPSTSSDSLYRRPTRPRCRTSDSGSILRDILDSQELHMYQQIAIHDPRFTVLLDDADDLSRQVFLVRKMYAAMCVVQERLTYVEECGVPELYHNFCRGAIGYKQSSKTFVGNEQRIIDLVGALNFSNRILESCRKHEHSLLKTVLDVQERRRARRSALARLLSRRDRTAGKQSSAVMVNGANSKLVGSITSSAGSETTTGSNIMLKRSELDDPVHIAAQNVLALREDLEDINGLVYKRKEPVTWTMYPRRCGVLPR
jgi:hypothetical protein